MMQLLTINGFFPPELEAKFDNILNEKHQEFQTHMQEQENQAQKMDTVRISNTN
jgi:hypothetical protein